MGCRLLYLRCAGRGQIQTLDSAAGCQTPVRCLQPHQPHRRASGQQCEAWRKMLLPVAGFVHRSSVITDNLTQFTNLKPE